MWSLLWQRRRQQWRGLQIICVAVAYVTLVFDCAEVSLWRNGAFCSLVAVSGRKLQPPLRLAGPVALTALPLERADGGNLLKDSSAVLDFQRSEFSDLEFMVPESREVSSLADLLNDGYERLISRYYVDGPLAWPINTLLKVSEREFKKVRLEQRLGKVLSKPSLRRPEGTDSIAVVLMQRGCPDGPPVGYVELLTLPADGRRAGPTAAEAADNEAAVRAAVDDAVDKAKFGVLPDLSSSIAPQTSRQPYLQFLCIAPGMRRRGLARALVGLAEAIVVQVWEQQRLYLHIDKDEAAANLVKALGYTVVGTPNPSHMGKTLSEEPK